MKFAYTQDSKTRAVKRLIRRFGSRKRLLIALMPRRPSFLLLLSCNTVWGTRSILARKCNNYVEIQKIGMRKNPYELPYYHRNDLLIKLLFICGSICNYKNMLFLIANKRFTSLSILFACHVDINQRDEEDYTLLERHLFDDEYEYRCKFLLDCGADLNLRNREGKTSRDQAVDGRNFNYDQTIDGRKFSYYNRKIIHLLDTYNQ